MGEPYYACYGVSGDTDGSVDPVIVDGDGHDVSDADLIKEGGAWPSVGVVTTWRGVVAFSLFGILVLAFFGLLNYAIEKPKTPAGRKGGWRTAAVVVAWFGIGISGLVAFTFVLEVLLYPDAVGLTVVALLLAAFAYGLLAQDIVRGRPLASWLRLRPAVSRLVVALIVSVALVPALLVGSVLLSALGEVPVTGTLLIGLVVLAVCTSALAVLLVVNRWRTEQRSTPPLPSATWRRSLALALVVALWAAVVAVVISLAAG